MPKKKTSLGFLFWIAFILLILVVFLFNKTRIDNVIESTGFLDIVKKKVGIETQPEVKISPVENQPEENRPEVKVPDTDGKTDRKSPESGKNLPETGVPGDTTVKSPLPDKRVAVSEKDRGEKEAQENGTKTDEQGVEKKISVPSKPTPVKQTAADPKKSVGTGKTDSGTEKPELLNTRKAKLYYVLVGDDGHISLKGVERTVSYKDSPMSATLDSLIAGPTRHDISEGLMSLIPENSKLLSATVKNGTAILNFNEAFRFNTLGMDGYLAQLKQIVYSATEFSTVKNVQILIEGNKLQYLTAEGIFIGAPLDRSSF